jgi:hypothetical protein
VAVSDPPMESIEPMEPLLMARAISRSGEYVPAHLLERD